MAKLLVLFSFCMLGMAVGMPANNDQLDKKRRDSGEYVATTRSGQSYFKEYVDNMTYQQRNSSATVNDVAINTVSEDRKGETGQHQFNQLVPSTVEISGISTGVNPAPANPATPQDNGGFRPQRAGSMFARIIDDIFQIPITVLQNVARLITNPFAQARKEAAQAA
ncbi:uncharacterized protein LOC109533721 [Dendroctonus ponderosae]|nr:uncharacterized protein LOC109533721 [Dendroctonus ponderosae]KAH1028815.1 hypothetical protein HUJ05_002145 [Dendroctonus ponderosae]KAH1028816.1 hypothetical protein HUJ05_002145 [Dendroctonus ponderosae]